MIDLKVSPDATPYNEPLLQQRIVRMSCDSGGINQGFTLYLHRESITISPTSLVAA